MRVNQAVPLRRSMAKAVSLRAVLVHQALGTVRDGFQPVDIKPSKDGIKQQGLVEVPRIDLVDTYERGPSSWSFQERLIWEINQAVPL